MNTLTNKAELIYATFDTPAGAFTVLADDEPAPRIRAAGFTADVQRMTTMLGAGIAARPAIDGLPEMGKAVDAYFDGDLTAIDAFPLAYPQTGRFQQAAWDAMREVTPGTTITYTELAVQAGSPAAVRAAGSACAKNRIALFVPCHRVVRTDGTLGGFAYGLECKTVLLNHERDTAKD